MKKWVLTTLAVLVFLGIAGGIFFYYQNTRFKYNNENAVGNSAGNLHNGGLFCEYNGKIYFANPYDNNYLYSMDSDCTNAKKLNSDSVAYLNVCGNYIYYVKNNFSKKKSGVVMQGQLYGIYRTDLDGKNEKALYDDLSGAIGLYGNYLYYQHYDKKEPLSLYKVKIDGKDNVKINDTPFDPSSYMDSKMYFSNQTKKYNIAYMDLSSGSTTTFADANAYLVDAEGQYIYYIDVSKGYSLVRMNSSTKTIELLYSSEGKIVNYNVYGNKIFFQMEGDNAGLYRMNADGTQLEFLASGNLTNVHCTSQYTFFQYFENQGVLYRVPTSGPVTKVEEITIK